MDRVLKIIFYGVLGLLFTFVIYMTLVMYLSPRQDLQKRGFIPCTETLVYNISDCAPGQIKCPLGYLWQDMMCNVGVITDGFMLWSRGKQDRPWSNYLFIPETEEDEGKIYVGTENTEEVYDINAANLFIAAKQQELNEAKERKINFDTSVILNNPEELDKVADDLSLIRDNQIKNTQKGDIGDELPSDDELNEKTNSEINENILQGKENEK